MVRQLSTDTGIDFAEAIMTTDTRRKVCVVQSRVDGRLVTIAGVAKGAGMIQPRMATMLAFVTTDDLLTLSLLKKALRKAVESSFNRVTVDGDTSTNDSIFLFCNGQSRLEPIRAPGWRLDHFNHGLKQVCVSLAMQIARDGEGAKKMIQVKVDRAKTNAEAERVARAIANSPLVKTAMAGADANWGRILCAAGYSGAPINAHRVDIFLNGIAVCRHGEPVDFDETQAKSSLCGKDIRIELNLNRGKGSAVIWTCDLTEGYIHINGSYRT